jgi:hypothetical protein
MLEKINQKYSGFSDAAIQEVNYNRYLAIKGIEDGMIEVILKTKDNHGDYDTIRLLFLGIITFRFVEILNTSRLVINKVLLKEKDGIITFDFFPIIYETGIHENVNSDFIIKCMKVSYEVLKP